MNRLPIKLSASLRLSARQQVRFNSVSASSVGHTPGTSSPQPRFQPPPAPKSGSTLHVGKTFLALTLTGMSVTAYGVWSFYSSFETWPPELRPDLRAALKAEKYGELKKAASRYQQALSIASQLTDQQLGSDALLKRTGIAISLASLLEKAGYLDAAYEIYRDAWVSCLTSLPSEDSTGSVIGRTGPERARSVALSQKLGEIAQNIAEVGPSFRIPFEDTASPADLTLQALKARNRAKDSSGMSTVPDGAEMTLPSFPPLQSRQAAREAAEKHLVWSVEELLKLSLAQNENAGDPHDAGQSSSASPSTVPLADLELPPWVSRTDLLGSIESLGSFYASRGRAEYAIPLYLQALQFLVPMTSDGKIKAKAGGAPITVSDRCRAAIVLNNLSHVLSESAEAAAAAAAAAAAVSSPEEMHPGKGGREFAWGFRLINAQDYDDGELKTFAQLRGRRDAAQHYAKRGLQLVQETNAKAGWGLAMDPDTSLQSPPKRLELVGSKDETRTAEVKRECLACEVALLLNLGSLATAREERCDARNYLQRAWRLAEREGFREARNLAGSLLAGLERFNENR